MICCALMLIKSRHQSYWPLLLSLASSKSSVWDTRAAIATLSEIWMFFQKLKIPPGLFNKLISWLVLGVCLQGPPITYSKEHLPLFATDGNPQGHRLNGGLHFAAGYAQRSRGSSGFLCIEEDWRPRGRHCVDIVFGHFEQCYLRQWGAMAQSIILLLDQHLWLFILDLWYWPMSNGFCMRLLFPSLLDWVLGNLSWLYFFIIYLL